jgi:chromosome segregation ATPase
MKNYINTIKNDYTKNYNNLKTKNEETIILLISKIKNFENSCNTKISEIDKKYQKYLSEQIRINKNLERQNKNLVSEKNNDNLKSRDLLFKKIELENEVKNYVAQNEKLKKEIDKKNNDYETMSHKNQLLIKNYSNNITNLVLMLNKLKKKYQSNIFELKSQTNNITQSLQNNVIKKGNELRNKINFLKNKIAELINDKDKYNENIKELNQQISQKDKEILSLKDTLAKIKTTYINEIKNSNSHSKNK